MSKQFKAGDIVFWCRHFGNADYRVGYGIVDEQFSDVVRVLLMELKDMRRINGIPIQEFETEQHFKKLPKGWTWDTELFECSYDSFGDKEKIDMTDPNSIKKYYDLGIIVLVKDQWHGYVDAEITKDGWRLRRYYGEYKIDNVGVHPFKLYFSYEEAKKEVDACKAEFLRQASLSDYDWSVEHIDRTLDMWANMYSISNEEKQQYREYILSLDKVEDIEVRIFRKHIQWKYWKNKKWITIEL